MSAVTPSSEPLRACDHHAEQETADAEQRLRDVLAALGIPDAQRVMILAAASSLAKARAHAERDKHLAEREDR